MAGEMTRQMVREVLTTKRVNGSLTSDSVESDALADVIAWLQGLLLAVPEPHRGTAAIEFNTFGDYDGPDIVEVEVYYLRPETDEELARRETVNNMRQGAIMMRELDELERLKKKYS